MLKLLNCSWIYRTLLVAALGLVSLQPLAAQLPQDCRPRPAATVSIQTGQVSIIQGIGLYKALSVGDNVCATQIVKTGPNSFAKFTLADNSTFEVYENSQVTFNKEWPSWNHLLDVIIGRVKLYIDHSKGPNNNSVTTPVAVISVRGTVFDVVVEDNDTTLVSVDEGQVNVHPLTAIGGDKLINGGDVIRVYRNQPLLGRQIDKGGLMQKALKVGRDAAYQVLLGRNTGGPGIPSGGSPGTVPTGSQGDGKGKQTGTSTGAPAPPAPPPGGGGG